MDGTPQVPMKFCPGCDQWLPRESFSHASRKKDGLQHRCKACNKAYVELHKEEIREKRKLYFEANKEARRKRQQEIYYADIEAARARMRQYRANHKEVMYEIEKRRRQKHQKTIRERKKKWQQTQTYKAYQERYRTRYHAELIQKQRKHYAANREQMLERRRRYGRTERGRMSYLLNTHRRRAYKRASSGSYTAQQIHQQIERQKSRCYYCKEKLGKEKHIEHIVPLSRGGTNDISNIVIACPTCNLKKGAKLPHEWPEGGRLL